MFAHLFHVRPFEWGQLTYVSLRRLIAVADQHAAEIKAAGRAQ